MTDIENAIGDRYRTRTRGPELATKADFCGFRDDVIKILRNEDGDADDDRKIVPHARNRENPDSSIARSKAFDPSEGHTKPGDWTESRWQDFLGQLAQYLAARRRAAAGAFARPRIEGSDVAIAPELRTGKRPTGGIPVGDSVSKSFNGVVDRIVERAEHRAVRGHLVKSAVDVERERELLGAIFESAGRWARSRGLE